MAFECTAEGTFCAQEERKGCCVEWSADVPQDLEDGQECPVTMYLPDGGTITKTVTAEEWRGGCRGGHGSGVGVDPNFLAFP